MSHKTKQVNRNPPDYAMIFFVLLATGLGAYLWISQAIHAGFPIHDGGLFYAMTRDIQASGFHLPTFATYNNIQIPFVYPPLAFYLAGFLANLTNWPLLKVFQILPSIIASLAIPAFYLLARDLSQAKAKTALATLFFALIPGGFYWLVMGGGITRSFGFLFYILTLWSTHRMYTLQKKKYIFLTALLGALACLSHPEAAVHTLACAILFFFLFGKSKRGLVFSAIVAALVLLLTAPWWGTVLARHGISPILTAGGTGGYNLKVLFGYIQGNLTQEPFLAFLGCFTIVGLFYEISKKRYFLPLWFLVVILSEPRSGPLYLLPLIALFAAIVMVDLIFSSFHSSPMDPATPESSSHWAEAFFTGRIAKISFAFFLAYFVMSAFVVSLKENQALVLQQGDLEAFEWINNNLPRGQRFLVVTGEDPLLDPTAEWFPALTSQTSLTTVQGHEWLNDMNFDTFRKKSAYLQLCSVQDIQCVEEWKKESCVSFDYVYFRNWEIQDRDKTKFIKWPLEVSLMESGLYQTIYETENSSILQVIK